MTLYARLITESSIQYAPRAIVIGDTTITNPNEAQLNQAGYYELVDRFEMITEKKIDPETGEEYEVTYEKPAKEFYHYENHYEKSENSENSEKIIHTHIEVKDNEPARVDMIVKKIRAEYSVDDELALQRQKDNSEEKKEAFNTYNARIDEIKAEVDDYIARWQEA